jgi:hypothetical protein
MATPWADYRDKLAEFIQGLEGDSMRIINTTQPDGMSRTFASPVELMRAYKMANEQAEEEALEQGNSRTAYGPIRLTRSW